MMSHMYDGEGSLHETVRDLLIWQIEELRRAVEKMRTRLFPDVPLPASCPTFTIVEGIKWPYVNQISKQVNYFQIQVDHDQIDLVKSDVCAQAILSRCATSDDVMNALKQISAAINQCRQCYQERLQKAEEVAKSQPKAVRYIKRIAAKGQKQKGNTAL